MIFNEQDAWTWTEIDQQVPIHIEEEKAAELKNINWKSLFFKLKPIFIIHKFSVVFKSSEKGKVPKRN